MHTKKSFISTGLLFFLTLITAIALAIFFVVPKAIVSACDKPFTYTLGTVDSRFGISQQQFLSDIAQAEAIWEGPENKNLFDYQPSSKFTINLLFDERQQLTDQLKSTSADLQNKGKTVDQLKAEYDQLKSTYENELAAYNAKVAYWNSRGGAPPADYSSLQTEQQQLKQTLAQLNTLAQQTNQSVNTYNQEVNTLNATSSDYTADRQGKPEEGIYLPADNRIEIYHFDNQQELIHTIAHELGHALGLEHVTDPQAIMYASSSGSLTASGQDLAELTQVCSKKTFDPNRLATIF